MLFSPGFVAGKVSSVLRASRSSQRPDSSLGELGSRVEAQPDGKAWGLWRVQQQVDALFQVPGAQPQTLSGVLVPLLGLPGAGTQQ